MGPMKVYVMPDGVKRQYIEGTQPEGAVELKEKPEAPKKAPKKAEE